MLACAQLINLTVFKLVMKAFRRLRKLPVDVAAPEVLVALFSGAFVPPGTIITIVVSTTSPCLRFLLTGCRIWLSVTSKASDNMLQLTLQG